MLLLATDFNSLHKINFNGTLTPSLEDYSAMPQSTIGSRISKAYAHLALSKRVIADVSKTKKFSSVAINAYANKCFDRVAHPYASLCGQ